MRQKGVQGFAYTPVRACQQALQALYATQATKVY